MKKLCLLTLLLTASLFASPLLAQDREADHQALRALRERLASALSETDADALADCFVPQFAFTGSDQTIATNREELEAYYSKWFRGDDPPLERMEVAAEADALTQFTGPDTGFSYGTGVITYHLTAGPVVPIPSRWTATLRKIDDEWKAETVHVGVNILENPVMKARVGFWRNTSFAAGVVGLLLGVFLSRFMGRSKKAAQ